MFVDPGNGNYHLQQESACIDAGSNAAVPGGITVDIGGDDRIIDGNNDGTAIVDMGAYEAPEAITTVWVDDDYTPIGDNDGHTWQYDAFDNIQDGIDALYENGTATIAPGHYTENIIISRDVVLVGAGYWQCTIDGNSNGTVVYANGVGIGTKIEGFTITGGSGYSPAQSGGGLFLVNSDLFLNRCVVTGNATSYGGGMSNELGSLPTLRECLFFDNNAAFGGAIDNSNSSSATIINCTFTSNIASGDPASDGGAIYNENNSSAIIANSILWEDSGNEIYNDATSSTSVEYSNIQGGHPGSFNIDTDPMFVSTTDHNFRLKQGSPCMETGTNTVLPIFFTTDLDGWPRVSASYCQLNANIDMGAYEFNRRQIGDFNTDCIVNLVDFAELSTYWLGDEPSVDISPIWGDGSVDIGDLQELCSNWLECGN